MYTPFFKSDLINNMDHMRISGTEPSSVVSRISLPNNSLYSRPGYNDNSDKLNEKIFQSNKDNFSNNFDHVHSYFI